MSNPYPLQRETRQTSVLAGDGRSTYGPFAFRIWSVDDVAAARQRGEEPWTVATISASKVSAAPFDVFTVTFTPPLSEDDSFVVFSKRLQERSTDVTRGGSVSGNALERELSTIGTILQELRRDVDHGYTLAPGAIVDAAQQAVSDIRSYGALTSVPTRAALAALDPAAFPAAQLREAGREGVFFLKAVSDAELAADTQQGLYVKPPAAVSGDPVWVRDLIGKVIVPQWFGCKGDDSLQDAGLTAFFDALMRTGEPGYVPPGFYRHSGQIVFDLERSSRQTINMRGAGRYKTQIISGATTGDAILFKRSGSDDANGQRVHTAVTTHDLTLVADTTGSTLTIDGFEEADTAGNYDLQRVHVVNINSAKAAAASLTLNYVFDSTFHNVTVVGNVGYGDALRMNRSHFNVFIGGSYSNALNGIVFNGFNISNSFISPDMENVRVGVLNVTANDETNTLTNPYFDIFNPETGENGGVCVKSTNCGAGGLVMDTPYFVPRSGVTLLDDANQVNVFVRGGCRPTMPVPAFPASDAVVKNNTGRSVVVRLSNLGGTVTAIFINNEETPVNGGTLVLLARQTIAIRYTGTAPVWRWDPII